MTGGVGGSAGRRDPLAGDRRSAGAGRRAGWADGDRGVGSCRAFIDRCGRVMREHPRGGGRRGRGLGHRRAESAGPADSRRKLPRRADGDAVARRVCPVDKGVDLSRRAQRGGGGGRRWELAGDVTRRSAARRQGMGRGD